MDFVRNATGNTKARTETPQCLSIGAYGDQLNSVDSTEFSKVSIRTNQSITMMNPSNLRGLSYKCIKEYWRERWS